MKRNYKENTFDRLYLFIYVCNTEQLPILLYESVSHPHSTKYRLKYTSNTTHKLATLPAQRHSLTPRAIQVYITHNRQIRVVYLCKGRIARRQRELLTTTSTITQSIYRTKFILYYWLLPCVVEVCAKSNNSHQASSMRRQIGQLATQRIRPS